MALQLRRGTNAQRLAVTPLDGELIVVTDYAAADVSPLWLGDGATVGGVVPITLELDDLTDVTIAALVDKQILQYNGLTGEWNNISNPVLTGLTAGNITVGLTDDNTITTTAGNLTINAAGGTVTIDDAVTVTGTITNNGTLNTNSGSASVYNTSATTVNAFGAATTIVMGATTGTTTIRNDLQVTGNDIKSSTGGTAITLSGVNVTVAGDLAVNGGDITSTDTFGNIFNTGVTDINIGNGATSAVRIGAPAAGTTQIKSQLFQVDGEAIIAGNLTVNGDLTYLNVADLQVEDKNIILAKGNTTDVFANAGGITLKGATDKTISWQDLDNRWYFNNGDGVEHEMIVGEFTTLSERAKFINNAGGIVGAEFLKRVTTAADGNSSGIFFGNIDASNDKLLTQRIISEYDTGGNNILRVQTDPASNFSPTSTTVRTQLSVDDTGLFVAGNQLILNSNQATAPTLNATIAVERGTSTNAELGWIESTGFWSFNQPVFVQGGLIGADFIGTNGNNIYFNNEDTTPSAGDNANLVVKRGSGADMTFRWNETSDRWESTTDGTNYVALPNQNLDTASNPAFAGVTGGNVRVGIATDNEIDTTTGNLTLDSAGGTVTVDDNLSVAGSNTFTVGTGTATFNGDIFHNGSTANFTNGIAANNLRIATTDDNTITTSSGPLRLRSTTDVVDVLGALTVINDITTTTGSVKAGSVTIGNDGVNLASPGSTTVSVHTEAFPLITTTSTTPTSLNMFAGTGAQFSESSGIDFTIQARKGTELQIVKGMLLTDTVNTFLNIYSDLRTGSADLFTVTATITAGLPNILVASTSATSTKYTGVWTGHITPN